METRIRVGHAVELDGGAALYVEHHREKVQGLRVVAATVQYEDSFGKVFARKSLDFGENPLLPAFTLQNFRTGHEEGLLRDAAGVSVRYRAGSGAEPVQIPIEVPAGAIGDAGIDQFVAKHWDQLLAGNSFIRPFLVPSRQSFVAFTIRLVRSAADGPSVQFEMIPNSWWLRLLLPPLVVEYDRDGRRLESYEGLSNLRDEQGEPYSVRIRFSYPAQWPLKGADARGRNQDVERSTTKSAHGERRDGRGAGRVRRNDR